MTTLEPDRDQIEIFVDALLRYRGSEGFISLRSFVEHDDSAPAFRILPVPLKGDFRFLIDCAEDDARRAAQAPLPVVFAPPLAVFNNNKTAGEEDMLAGLVLSVECDRTPHDARRELEALLDRPPSWSAPAVNGSMRTVWHRTSSTSTGASKSPPAARMTSPRSRVRAPAPPAWSAVTAPTIRFATRSAGRAAGIARKSRVSAASSRPSPTAKSRSQRPSWHCPRRRRKQSKRTRLKTGAPSSTKKPMAVVGAPASRGSPASCCAVRRPLIR